MPRKRARKWHLRLASASLCVVLALGAPAEAASPPPELTPTVDPYDFTILEGQEPISDETFLVRLKDVDPQLAARDVLFEPARWGRKVATVGLGTVGVGLGVLVAAWLLQQVSGGGSVPSENYLAGGYGRAVGAAIAEIGVGVWGAGMGGSYLLMPHPRAFNMVEAYRAMRRYNQLEPPHVDLHVLRSSKGEVH